MSNRMQVWPAKRSYLIASYTQNRFSIIGKSQGVQWRKINRFASLQKELGVTLDELRDLADDLLKKEIYSRNDILDILDVDDVEFEELFLSANTKGMSKFNLRDRGLHVLQGEWTPQVNFFYKANTIPLLAFSIESIRVYKFCDLCRSNGAISDLSMLMRQSHLSLDIQYQCSHPKLNELVEISDRFGVGARLTGAG